MFKKVISLAAGLLLSAPVFATNLVKNGSFEQGVDPGSFRNITAGDTTSIADWKVEPGYQGREGGVDYVGSYWQPSDGARSIDLNGNAPGAISQTINTVIGERYRVWFDLSANPDSPRNTRYGTVSFSADSAEFIYRFSDQLTSNTRENMNWLKTNYEFVATRANTKLSFVSGGNGAFGPALDNVKVVGGVPEPQMWALLLIGFGMVGVAARGRDKAIAA